MWNRDRSERNLFDRPVSELAKVEPAKPEPPKAEAAAPARPLEPEPKAEAKVEAPATRRPAAPPPVPAPKGSTLGPTLRFKGDLVADEDLVVQGQLEGSILHTRLLTIGPDGSMKGDIRARRIVVEGRVDGDLYALESVTVRATGHVRGSLYAPRVAIAEGANFNGTVDMEKAPQVPALPGATAGAVASGGATGAGAGAPRGTEAALDGGEAGVELSVADVDGLLRAKD